MDCEYCAKFGNTNILEHLVNKKSFYCKRCGNYFGEDDVNARIKTEAGGFPLTVVKDDIKTVKKTKSSGKGKDILSDDS